MFSSRIAKINGNFRGKVNKFDENGCGGLVDRDRSIPFFNGGVSKSVYLRSSLTPVMGETPLHDGGGRNLPFGIVSSSGQDEDYPATELNKGIQGRGWQSSRFCFYPQELVLELQWPSQIVNMQLLCHEYKIPSKVEVFVSLVKPWVHSEKAISQMKRLGYLSLDPNDRSGHQARELKSIHVDSPASVVRLVLHTCYTNKLNTYNQVGLMALIITGNPLEENHMTKAKQRGFSPLLTTPRVPASSSKGSDSTLSAVDSFTAARIQRLQQEKVAAVQEEDYDEAKRLKILIDKLKGLGEQIKQLELQKRAAVEVEDYDAAKICKMEIEMLRKCDGVLAESLTSVNETRECTFTAEGLHSIPEQILHATEDTNSESIRLEGNFKSSDSPTWGKEIWTQTLEPKASTSFPKEIDSLLPRREIHNLAGDPPEDRPRANQAIQARSGFLSWWKGKKSFKNQSKQIKSPLEKIRQSDEDLTPSLRETALAEKSLKASVNQMEKSNDDLSSRPFGENRKSQEDIRPSLNQIIQTATDSNSALQQLRNLPEDAQPLPKQMKSSDENLKPFSNQLANIEMHKEEATSIVPFVQRHDVEQESIDSGSQASSSIGAPLPQKKSNSFIRDREATRESYREGHPPHVIRAAPPLAQHSVKHSLAISQPNGPHTSSADDNNGPEPLSEAAKLESAPLLNLLDLYHVQCLYSKQWQLRDKAFQFIAKMLLSNGRVCDFSSFRILDSVLIRALNDRVPNVFYSGLQLLRAYVNRYSGEVSPKELQLNSTEFVNILLDKLGDSNVRSKDAASETLMFMASKKELGLEVVARPLLKPAKNQAIWKPVLGRLNWLLVGVPTFGVQPQSRQGFSSEMLMTYVSHAINSPNGEVRNASVKVITEVYKLMGATVERYLKGIKPMIREVLISNFEKVALETRGSEEPLTYEELENIPIRRKSRKSAVYDINKALDIESQKTTNFESPPAAMFEPELVQTSQRGKAVKDGGLHTMLIEQEYEITDPENLQTMYSTEATAPVENFSLLSGEEPCKEAGVLTQTRDSQEAGEAKNDASRAAENDASYGSQSYANKDRVDEEFQVERDELSDQCLFCGKQDPNFLKEDNLDLHFCQDCPMLVGCCNCKQIVEIASLKDHYLGECTSGRRYFECSKCSQAIPEIRMTAHFASKECRQGKHYKATRCPLCHHAVEPGDAGWRTHLLQTPGCPKNSRPIH